MNGRPLGNCATVRLLIALTILAWATQTLLHQWGYGAERRPQWSRSNLSPAPSTTRRG